MRQPRGSDEIRQDETYGRNESGANLRVGFTRLPTGANESASLVFLSAAPQLAIMETASTESSPGDASFLPSSPPGFLSAVAQSASIETASSWGDHSGHSTVPASLAPSEKLIDVLYGFALADPGRKLFDWLDDKGDISHSFSRGDLWNRGRILASRLERDGITRGDFVMIVYP